MGIDPTAFRRLMRHVATGVTVVATRRPGDGCAHGLTANSIASVSLAPPLVLVCIQRSLRSHDCIRDAGFFSINVLGEEHEGLSRHFANSALENRFDGIPHDTALTGAPILPEALAWMDCRTWAAYPGGDHTIYVGEVVAAGARDGLPLLFLHGDYARVRLPRVEVEEREAVGAA